MSEANRIVAHTQKGDHVSEGLGWLTSGLRGKARLAALLSSWLRQVQAVEDALWQVLIETTLDASVGAQLDQLGAIVGCGRDALDDEPYRMLLRAWILANRSSGTGDELLAILAVLSGGDGATTLTESAPAAVVIGRSAPWPVVSVELVAAAIRRAKSAGVRVLVEDLPEGDVFTLAPGEDLVVDAFLGLSDTGGTSGGQLAGVV